MTSQTPSNNFKSTFASNTDSKFDEWSIQLRNGATLTGIAYIPSSHGALGAASRPLLVGIHGGTCSAYTYDVSPSYTGSTYAELSGIPFVAFHRPNYLGSSGWLVDRASDNPTQPRFRATEGLTYFQEEARWFHEFIFPALWEAFAVPNGCSSLVTTSHSMGVMPTVIASTHYSSETDAKYIWSGMVLSGLGETGTQHCAEVAKALLTNTYEAWELPVGQDSSIHRAPFRRTDKEDLMLGPEGVCDSELRPRIWKQTTPFIFQEILDLFGMWQNSKQAYKAAVKIPVLYGIGEFDWIWIATKENVDLFCSEFTSAPRIEGALIETAPHAIELSRVAGAWWMRVFGWASEVASGQDMQRLKPKAYL